MDDATEVDEFEKYFQKSSQQVLRIHAEEMMRRGSLPETQKKANKTSKDRRGSSYKQPDQHRGREDPSSRKSLCNPFQDGQSSLLKPQINITNASSLPNSRQGSFKLTKTRSSKDIQEDLLSVSDKTARRTSMTPEEIAESKLKEINQLQKDNFVVRSFLTSPKGLVNRGDSFKKKPQTESSSVLRKNSDSKSRRLSEVGRSHRSSVHSTASASISDVIHANALATSENADPINLEPPSAADRYQFVSRPSIEITRCFFPDELQTQTQFEKTTDRPALKRILSHESPHSIVVIGDHRVGKTSLVTQFLTSEHLAGLDTSHDSSVVNDRTISVSVDGVETMLNFIDADIKHFRELESFLTGSECAAFLVVYSITDSASFHAASCVVEQLCTTDHHDKRTRSYAVILVANKGDLVRNRKVLDSDARDACIRCGCKFIEVSAGLNHKIDELLVGVVYQVRLNDKRRELLSHSSKGAAPQKGSTQSANYFGWFKKILGLKGKADESQCDDMQTL